MIEKNLDELEALKKEVEELDIHTTHSRILGSILHDFYSGVEKIFIRIANELEGEPPESRSWHKVLLDDMSIELEGVRPAVLDEQLRRKLEEFLRFRHLFRGVYGFQLNHGRLDVLFNEFPDTYSDFMTAMKKFIEFLKTLL